jgi:hypothetical protein
MQDQPIRRRADDPIPEIVTISADAALTAVAWLDAIGEVFHVLNGRTESKVFDLFQEQAIAAQLAAFGALHDDHDDEDWLSDVVNVEVEARAKDKAALVFDALNLPGFADYSREEAKAVRTARRWDAATEARNYAEGTARLELALALP